MLIAPEGWVDMNYEMLVTSTPLSDSLMANYIMTHNYAEFEAVFKNYGIFPEGKNNLKDIRLIDNQYLWALFE